MFVGLAGLVLRPGAWRAGSVPQTGTAGWVWLLIPFLWTGLEYFRSELYYLRTNILTRT